MKQITLSLIFTSIAMQSGIAIAQPNNSQDMAMDTMKNMPMAKQTISNAYKATGIVKKIDTANGTITLAHQAIPDLNWPAMTMGFGVADKKLLDKIKPGEAVQFSLKEISKGKYAIIELKEIK